MSRENRILDIREGSCLSINSNGDLPIFNLISKSHEPYTLFLTLKVLSVHLMVMIIKEFLDKYIFKYSESKYKKALWIRMYEKGVKFENTSELIRKYRIIENSLYKVNDKKIVVDTLLSRIVNG